MSADDHDPPDDLDPAADPDPADDRGADAENARGERRDEADRPTVQAALRAVRREAFKAALVYAIVDAAVVAVVVMAVLATVDVAAVPETVAVPAPAPVADAVGVGEGRVVVSGAAVVALAVALVNVASELLYVRRRDPVRWFERANPETAEALRTARDAAQAGGDDRLSRRLYADVLGRLRESSGARLLDRRRLAIPIVLLLLSAVVASQAVAIGLSVDLPDVDAGGGGGGQDGSGGDGGLPPPPGEQDDQEGGLGSGDDVLGDPTDVTPGVDPEDVFVDPGGGTGGADRPYETGGFPSEATAVDAEAAGFAPPEDVQDADLVREYTLAIRQAQEEDGDG